MRHPHAKKRLKKTAGKTRHPHRDSDRKKPAPAVLTPPASKTLPPKPVVGHEPPRAPHNTSLRVGQRYVTVNPPQYCEIVDVHPFGETATAKMRAVNGNEWEKTFTLHGGRLPVTVVPHQNTPLDDVLFVYERGNVGVDCVARYDTEATIRVTGTLHPGSEPLADYEVREMGVWLVGELAEEGHVAPLKINVR